MLKRHPLVAAALTALVFTPGSACKSNEKYREVGRGDASFLERDGSTAGGASARGGGSGTSGNGGAGSGGEDGADGGFTTAFDGAIPDGATLDAAVLGLDGAIDLPRGTVILEDGAIVLPDGEVIDTDTAVDRYTPEVDVSKCDIGEENTWSTEVDAFDEGGFSLMPGAVGFGLAFRSAGGGTSGCVHVIDAMPLSASSGFGDPRRFDNDCKVVTDLAIVAEGDGWRLGWVDNFTDSAELHTILLDSQLLVREGAKRQTLTSNTDQREHKPVLRDVAGRPFAAWITENTLDHARSISTLKLDGSSTANTVLAEADGQSPQSLAMAQMGYDKAAVAWVGPLESPGVWLQALDGDGAPTTERVKLTDKVAVSSSVDMANRDDGGGVIYSIEIDGLPQVRFRRLDRNGAPLANERTIIGPPFRAQGASIAPLGGGYAVTYRALPGGSVTGTEVRLAFVTKEGNVLRDKNGRLVSYYIGDATLAQGRTAVSVSVEGELMVAWVDGNASTGRNVLRVVRRHLACQ